MPYATVDHYEVRTSTFQNLGQAGELDSHGDSTVAAKVVKAIRIQLHADQTDVGRVHGLQPRQEEELASA